MSRRLLDPMPPRVVDSQRAASDPARSVWVTANAGSGKTWVLTARVLRLLLAGVEPEQILCLTYTRAAAAEMRARVGERLGRWALADTAALAADILTLTGGAPDAEMTKRARTLFARALDTPGGLRIQTIHAFCESVLHRFPREAGVPFAFSVIEEHERDAMLREARETVIASGLRGGDDRAAVETLFDLMSDFQIETAITEALGRQRTLRAVLALRPAAKRTLRRMLPDVGNARMILDEVVDSYGLDRADHDALFALVAPDPAGVGFIDRLAFVDPDRPEAEALFEAFLTQTRTARKSPLTKNIAALVPDVAARVAAEADRLERLGRELVVAALVARSEALLDIVAAIVDRYEAAKRARSLLDFDDLVERLGALLGDQARGMWVRYKLDTGIDHILVDEGQDTNQPQWDVVESLIAEFFVGDSAAQRPRTLFVVGDQKQSIFSFQGADPAVFVDLGRKVTYTARAVKFALETVKLRHSFRTLPEILAGVDRVFARPDLAAGVLEEEGVVHETARRDAGGVVTLWRPTKEEAGEVDPDNWPTEPPRAQTRSAPRQAAERIAREVRTWLDNGRMLPARGRAVAADDILILVQVRSVLFHEIIRALLREGIPTPGADRLAVTTHIGALDMMALGDVLSNASDDLQLAALLRSPLFEVSEEDLLAVAHPRLENTSLWQAMRESTIPSVAAARETLRRWRSRLDFDRPFNFFSSVLYAEGGLRKFRARFGAEIDDVMAEFLDLALAHEQSAQPSLLGFLAELRSREVIIKRELAAGGAGVRVMTVHGAKGLEAPVVILADAASTEIGRDRRAIYMGTNPPFFFHASSKETHADETLEHKAEADAAQKAEYWRKLYVAMTRAEDELYVTGYLTKRGTTKDSWYEAIEQALAPEAEIARDADGEIGTLVFPRAAAPAAAGSAGATLEPDTPLVLPPLPDYRLRRIVRPSRAAEDAEPARVFDTSAERIGDIRDPDAARREGIALHALLQHFARIAPAHWEAVALKAMPILLPDRPAAHAGLVARARSILTRPELSDLFGPDSRGEVPILALGAHRGAPVTIAGRIDRLVVRAAEVLIVDFKSDAVPARELIGVPDAYRTQLGLYALVAGHLFPGRRVRAAILWTGLESLLELPAAVLADAAAGFTLG